MPQACANTRVVKKLSATQPGAIKLARRYGTALVCVRYRSDKQGLIRYTTVELLVDEARIQKRKATSHTVAIRLEKHVFHLKDLIKSNGGRWDPEARVWRLPRSTAERFDLLNHVVTK